MKGQTSLPWYVWLVLTSALAMSAPGEYALAVAARWSGPVALLMPVVVSVYAAVAAYIAAQLPNGAAGRTSAIVGAVAALVLALSFQVTAHLVAAGYVHESAWMVAAVSGVPPLVVAHLMHMALAAEAACRPDTSAEALAVKAAPEAAATTADPVGRELSPGRPVAMDRTATSAATTGKTLESAGVDAVAVPAPANAAAAAAGGTVADEGGGPVAEPLPGLSGVTARPEAAGLSGGCGRRRTRQAGKGLPGPDDVRAAMAALVADGRPVTGRTVGDHFGVAERTGRRYLEMAA
ncbi:hypothetical protein AB8O64_27520 [Streptomyces sp. QH1-20]|uniref:hypothetical protein n=1 Tax=Streptomyces sp. QH1-20 TaxID=3240934 RepID=UPI003517774B